MLPLVADKPQENPQENPQEKEMSALSVVLSEVFLNS